MSPSVSFFRYPLFSNSQLPFFSLTSFVPLSNCPCSTFSSNRCFLSATVISANCSHSKRSPNTLPTSRNTSFIPQPRAPITTGTIIMSYPVLLSLNSNTHCRYFVIFHFFWLLYLPAADMSYHKSKSYSFLCPPVPYLVS